MPEYGSSNTSVTDDRISVEELQLKMRDLSVDDDELQKYFAIRQDAARPFSPAVIPNPRTVEVAAPRDAFEGAMLGEWANSLCRYRRQAKFQRRRANGEKLPVIVSEGDSWFQFPIFLDDVVDSLESKYLVWSVDAAGDTLQNMVLDNPEYMRALHEQAPDVRAFMFSGGGNDIIGEDADGRSVISQIVRGFEEGRPDAWYIQTDAFAEKLDFIESCYRNVIGAVAKAFPKLPVVCHGYAYAIPGGYGYPGDTRNPVWAAKDKWLGRTMKRDLDISDVQLACRIIALMIDKLNDRIRLLCGGNNPGGVFPNAWTIDSRKILGKVSLWADELHPSNQGFAMVGKEFDARLTKILAAAESAAEASSVFDEIQPAHHPGDDADVHPSELAGDTQAAAFEEAANFRIAKCLDVLRSQINARFPRRSKRDDGWIGDPRHQNRPSDHNPWVKLGGVGIVTALDVTHDPRSGCDGQRIADKLTASHDTRVKYIIWNRRICSSSAVDGAAPWTWRRYSGSNPHTMHIHISVKPEAASFDDEKLWDLGEVPLAGEHTHVEAFAHEPDLGKQPLPGASLELRPVSKPSSAFESAEAAVATEPRATTPGHVGEAAEASRSERHLVVKGKGKPLNPPANAFETVLGADDRTRILDTELAPWRMICALVARGPTGAGALGTGWFVGPRTILTAGHCVYSERLLGGWASKVDIAPGRNGSVFPYKTMTSSKVSSVSRWVDREDPDFDIGCIHLDARPQHNLGWFAIGALPTADLQSSYVNISGYPADRSRGTEQFHHRNRIVNVSQRRVFYDVDTYGGQSGAPVWIHENDASPPLVVGVHAYGVGASIGAAANSATRIIPELVEQVRKWVEADGGWPEA